MFTIKLRCHSFLLSDSINGLEGIIPSYFILPTWLQVNRWNNLVVDRIVPQVGYFWIDGVWHVSFCVLINLRLIKVLSNLDYLVMRKKRPLMFG